MNQVHPDPITETRNMVTLVFLFRFSILIVDLLPQTLVQNQVTKFIYCNIRAILQTLTYRDDRLFSLPKIHTLFHDVYTFHSLKPVWLENVHHLIVAQ